VLVRGAPTASMAVSVRGSRQVVVASPLAVAVVARPGGCVVLLLPLLAASPVARRLLDAQMLASRLWLASATAAA